MIGEPDTPASVNAMFEASYRCFALATARCDSLSHGLGRIVELLPTETSSEAREKLQDVRQILYVEDHGVRSPEIVAIDCRPEEAQALLRDGRFRELMDRGTRAKASAAFRARRLDVLARPARYSRISGASAEETFCVS